mgnify:CR=1 FL=1
MSKTLQVKRKKKIRKTCKINLIRFAQDLKKLKNHLMGNSILLIELRCLLKICSPTKRVVGKELNKRIKVDLNLSKKLLMNKLLRPLKKHKIEKMLITIEEVDITIEIEEITEMEEEEETETTRNTMITSQNKNNIKRKVQAIWINKTQQRVIEEVEKEEMIEIKHQEKLLKSQMKK